MRLEPHPMMPALAPPRTCPGKSISSRSREGRQNLDQVAELVLVNAVGNHRPWPSCFAISPVAGSPSRCAPRAELVRQGHRANGAPPRSTHPRAPGTRACALPPGRSVHFPLWTSNAEAFGHPIAATIATGFTSAIPQLVAVSRVVCSGGLTPEGQVFAHGEGRYRT